jgi:hypothetical protein
VDYWGAVISAFFLVFVEKLVQGAYGQALSSLVGGGIVTAAALHSKTWLQKTNPNWTFAAALALLFAIISTPWVEQKKWPFSTWFQSDTAAEGQKSTLIEWLQQAQSELVTKDNDLKNAQGQITALTGQVQAAQQNPTIGDMARVQELQRRLVSTEAELSSRPEVPVKPTENNPVLGNGPQIEAIKRMPPADRTRLSEVFYDLSLSFDKADKLLTASSVLVGNISWSVNNGHISNESTGYDSQLDDLIAKAKTYAKETYDIRQKWRYYDQQVVYIFGLNTDNADAEFLHSALETYKIYFDKWSKIQNKDDHNVHQLLSYPKETFNNAAKHFRAWYRGCDQRLGLLRTALQ